MGKRKAKNWQYKAKAEKRVDPGAIFAARMAAYQVAEEMRIRKAAAESEVVGSMMQEYTESVENWFYGLMALALHDEGWGAKRILRVMERIRDYHAEMNDPDFGDYDLWKVVRDEVKLDFDPGGKGLVRWEGRNDG